MPTRMEAQPTTKPTQRDDTGRALSWPVPSDRVVLTSGPPDSNASKRTNEATSEKPMGIHSAGCSNALTAWATPISSPRKAMLAITKSSTQSRVSAHQALLCSSRCMVHTLRASRESRRFLDRSALCFLTQLFRRLLEFGELGDDLVVTVPLDEVGPAHVGAMLRRPAAIMPQVERQVLDRFVKCLGREKLFLAELRDNILRLLDEFIGRANDPLRLRVELRDTGVRMALEADGLHLTTAGLIVRPAVRDSREQVV